MGDEHRLERAVFAPQTLHHPEEKSLGELAVAIRHAAGDIQKEEHDGMDGRLATAGKLAVAQIIIGESGESRLGCRAASQLLEGAPAIEPGARAAPIPALTHPVGVFRGPARAP